MANNADGIVDIEVLLKPLLQLDEKLVGTELKGVTKKLQAMLKDLGKKGQEITLRPGFDLGYFQEGLEQASTSLANYYHQADRLAKKSGGTLKEQIRTQQALIDARKRQATELRSLLKSLSKEVILDKGANKAAFDGLIEGLSNASESVKALTADMKRLDALTSVEKLQEKLKGMKKLSRVSTKDAISQGAERELKDREKVLLDLQKTASFAGQVGIAGKAEQEIEKIRRMLPALRAVRSLKDEANQFDLSSAELSERQLRTARKRQRDLETALGYSDVIHASTKKSLQVEQERTDLALQRHASTKKSLGEEERALDRIYKAQEGISFSTQKLGEFGDPRKLKVGSSQEELYFKSLGQFQQALGQAEKLVDDGPFAKEDLKTIRSMQSAVQGLIGIQQKRRDVAKKNLRDTEKEAAVQKKLRQDRLTLLDDLVRSQKLTASKQLGRDFEAGTAAAKAHSKALSDQARMVNDLIELDRKLHKGRGGPELNRRLAAIQKETDAFDKQSKTAQNQERTADKIRAARERVRLFAPTETELETAKVTKNLAALKVGATGVQKAIGGLYQEMELGEKKNAPALKKRIEYMEDLGERYKDAIALERKARKEAADVSGPKKDANLETLKRHEKLLDAYEAEGSIASRIAGSTKDLEGLKAVQRDLKEQARALGDIGRRYREYEQVGTRSLQEIRDRQKQVSAGLAETNKEIYKLTGGWAGLNQTVKQFFRYALFYGGMYELLGAFTLLGRSVIQLQADFKNIQAVTAATDADMVNVSAAIRNVALTTRFSAQEIAKAATTIGQAGVDPKDLQKVLQSTANFAAAVGGSIETAADLMTTFRDVYSELSEVEIADKLTKAINISKLTAEDLKTIVSISGQTAQDFGLSADQYLAAAGTLRNAGIKASTVTTGLRQLLIDIFAANSSSLKKLQGLYNELGEDLNAQQIQARFFAFTQSRNPLLSALEELERLGLGGRAAGRAGRLFEVRAMNVLRALLGNMEELRTAESRLTFGGAAAKAAETQMEALQAQLTNVGAALTFFGEELFRGPVEGLTEFFQWTTKVIGELHTLDLTLKSIGEEGLSKNLAAGGLVGLITGAVTPGGAVKKIVSGTLAGGGVAAGTVAQEKAGGEIDSAAATGYAAAAVGVYAAVVGGFKAIYEGVKGAGGAKQLSLDLDAKGLKGKFSSLFRIIPLVGRLLTGWVGVAAFGLYQLYDLFYENPLSPEEELKRLKDARSSAARLLRSELDDASEKLEAAKDYRLEGGGIGGQAEDLAQQVEDQFRLIEEIQQAVGSSVDVKAVQAVLRQFASTPGAGAALSGPNKAMVKELVRVLDGNEELAAGYAREFIQLLNMEKQLQASEEALAGEVEKRIQEAGEASQETLLDTPLGAFKEVLDGIRGEVDSALDGAEGDRAQVAESYKKLFGETYDRIVKENKEATDKISKDQDGAAEKLRQTTALVVKKLREAGKFPEAAREIEELIVSQRTYFGSLTDTLDAVKASFGAATEDLPKSFTPVSGYGGLSSEGYRTSFTDITGRAGAKYAPLIGRAAADQGINPRLLAALIRSESAFNPNAVSPVGAGGIAQFMPATGRQYGLSERDRFNPELAIPAAARLLRNLLDKYKGDVPTALAGYNAGEGAVAKYGGVPPYPETEEYIAKITRIVGLMAANTGYAGYAGTESTAEGTVDNIGEKLAKEEVDQQAKNILALVNLKTQYEDNAFANRLAELKTNDARKAHEYLTKTLGGTEGSLADYGDQVDKVREAYNEVQKELGEREAEKVAQQAHEDRLNTIALEDKQKQAQLDLENAKRRGASEAEYAAIRSRITGFELAKLANERKALESGQDSSKQGKDQEEELAKLANKEAEVRRQLAKDLETYGRARSKANAKLATGDAVLLAEQVKRQASIAIQQGDTAKLDQLRQQLIAAQTKVVEAKRREANETENDAERAAALRRLEAEEKGIVQALVELQKQEYDKLKEDSRYKLEGFATEEEYNAAQKSEAAGFEPSKAELVGRNELAIAEREKLAQKAAEYQTELNRLIQEGNLSLAAEELARTRINELTQTQSTLQGEVAQKQGETAALAGGLGHAWNVFTTNANTQFDDLSATIGGSMTSAVNGLTGALFDAGRAGESMGESLKKGLSSFFTGIAKAIVQALILKAITGGLGFSSGGTVPTAGNPTAGLTTPSGLLLAKGGVVRAAEGGIISGPPGIDNTPGAIVHPNGALSPMLVTPNEAILPVGMVQGLGGVGAVQAAIDRYNHTGQARFARGAVVGQSGSSTQSQTGGTNGTPVQVKIVNVPGTSVVSDFMTSTEGEQIVLNALERNPTRARMIMGG